MKEISLPFVLNFVSFNHCILIVTWRIHSRKSYKRSLAYIKQVHRWSICFRAKYDDIACAAKLREIGIKETQAMYYRIRLRGVISQLFP
jgi:hypothetical protein